MSGRQHFAARFRYRSCTAVQIVARLAGSIHAKSLIVYGDPGVTRTRNRPLRRRNANRNNITTTSKYVMSRKATASALPYVPALCRLGEAAATALHSPTLFADWPDDIRYFCQALITAPGEMVNIPRLTFHIVRVDAYPTTLEGAVQHNALWDARALCHRLFQKERG